MPNKSLIYKKNTPQSGGETVGQRFLLSGGFEEDYLWPACHSKPSMVVNISCNSRKSNVDFRKILIMTPQKATTQMHTYGTVLSMEFERKTVHREMGARSHFNRLENITSVMRRATQNSRKFRHVSMRSGM
jgi:hypothetical protein